MIDPEPPSPSSSSSQPRKHVRRVSSRVRFQAIDLTPLTINGSSTTEAGDPHRTGTDSLSHPGTPNIREAADSIRRTLSLASLDTLLLLTSASARPTTSSPYPLGSTFSATTTTTTTATAASAAIAKRNSKVIIGSSSTSSSPATTPTSSVHDFFTPSVSVTDDADAFELAVREAEADLNRRREEVKGQLREALRDAKGLVVRPAGDGWKRPNDWERVWVLALSTAMRSFISAYSLRAGVNIVVYIFALLRGRRFRPRDILRTLFAETPLRFSLLLSTFAYVHTLAVHILRLAPPTSYIKRRTLHSMSLLRRTTRQSESFLEALEEGVEVLAAEARGECSFGPPSAEYDEYGGERRWHAAAAGALAGGCAIYWISRKTGERRGVMEQLLVRGLEGAWNGVTRKTGVRIPGGEILLFGLCAGQIMHSWLLAPSYLPHSFDGFINGAFQGPAAAVEIQRSLMSSGKMPASSVEKLFSWKRGVSPENVVALREILARARADGGAWDAAAPFIPCPAIHPDHTHCVPNLVSRFGLVFQHTLPVYLAIHFVPKIFFMRNRLFGRPEKTSSSSVPAIKDASDPMELERATKTPDRRRINWGEVIKLLWKGSKGTVRSCSFLAMFVVIYHGVICMQHQLFPYVQGRLRKALVGRKFYWVAGFLTSLSLFLEEKRRRSELALYVLPRGISTLYSTARRRRWVPKHVPLGDGLIAAVAMGVICDRARWGPEDLSGLVRRVLYQFT